MAPWLDDCHKDAQDINCTTPQRREIYGVTNLTKNPALARSLRYKQLHLAWPCRLGHGPVDWIAVGAL